MDLQKPSRIPLGETVAFLHRMDCIRGEAIVTTCDRPSLHNATFLDGREQFWQAERLIPLVPMGAGAAPVRRFIFHVGFAGSTLLARLLDDPGRVLTLKEPHCLADLAGQRAAIEAGEAIAPLDVLVDHALGRLGDLGHEDLPVLVKPTNWANCILRELCNPRRKVSAVFVSMPLRDYLTAVFRGGRDRLAFCARLAADMAKLTPAASVSMSRAVQSSSDPLDQMARFAALLHWMQEREFSWAIAANGWSDDVRIELDELLDRPNRTAARARKTLGLPKAARSSMRTERLLNRHAKEPSQPFSMNRHEEQSREVERHHGARLDAAAAWLDEQNLPG